MEARFKVGDLVFARLKGFEPWPAKIENIKMKGPSVSQYEVRFYADCGRLGYVKPGEVWPYDEYMEEHFPFPNRVVRVHVFFMGLYWLERDMPAEQREKLSYKNRSFPDYLSLNPVALILLDKYSQDSLLELLEARGDKNEEVKFYSKAEKTYKTFITDIEGLSTDALPALPPALPTNKVWPKYVWDCSDESEIELIPYSLENPAPVNFPPQVKAEDIRYTFFQYKCKEDSSIIQLITLTPSFDNRAIEDEWEYHTKNEFETLQSLIKTKKVSPDEAVKLNWKWQLEAYSEFNNYITQPEHENKLDKIYNSLRRSVCKNFPCPLKAIRYLEDILKMEMTPAMLIFSPSFVDLIMKLMFYEGPLPKNYVLEEHNLFLLYCHRIRNFAREVHKKMAAVFLVSIEEFTDYYTEKVNDFWKTI